MADTFQFELVSPEKLIVSRQAGMVTVPGGEGEYGVLPGHAPLITTVKAGVIEIYDMMDGPVVERIFVSGGFAETTQQQCTVLATEAVPVASLNKAKIEEQAKSVSEKLNAATGFEREALLEQQDVLAAKLQAAA